MSRSCDAALQHICLNFLHFFKFKFVCLKYFSRSLSVKMQMLPCNNGISIFDKLLIFFNVSLIRDKTAKAAKLRDKKAEWEAASS